jgi:F-type H+-transporting ATPase subunit b
VSNLTKKLIPAVAAFSLFTAVSVAAAQNQGATPTKAVEAAKAELPAGHSHDDGHDHSHDHSHDGVHAHAHESQGLIASVSQGVVTSVTTLVVFGLVFGVLATAVWPKILKGLKDRENKIREEIESAEMARQQAKDALEQYQKSLADARAEATKMLETTRAQQAQLAADLKAKADVELTAMRERALKDIETAKRAAVSELYSQSSQLAAIMAGKILRRSVTAEDSQRLLDESIQQLQSGRN